jgi:hypothetical protein
MTHKRGLPFSILAGVLFLSPVLIAQTPRSAIVPSESMQKKTIPCPTELICDLEPPTPALSIVNNLGVAISGAGTHTGVFGHGGGDNGIGVAGTGVTGLFGQGGDGPGLIVASSGPDILDACFSNGTGCSNGNVLRVDNTGKVFANGGFQTGGADVAEFIRTAESVEPGDVVEIDSHHSGQFRKAATRGSTAVAGVISTKPGLTMNSSNSANVEELGPQLALVGRVRVKVTAENGQIRPGDLLVSSGTAGYAMRAGKSPRPGTIFGKALGNLEEGTGIVEMLVWSR